MAASKAQAWQIFMWKQKKTKQIVREASLEGNCVLTNERMENIVKHYRVTVIQLFMDKNFKMDTKVGKKEAGLGRHQKSRRWVLSQSPTHSNLEIYHLETMETGQRIWWSQGDCNVPHGVGIEKENKNSDLVIHLLFLKIQMHLEVLDWSFIYCLNEREHLFICSEPVSCWLWYLLGVMRDSGHSSFVCSMLSVVL